MLSRTLAAGESDEHEDATSPKIGTISLQDKISKTKVMNNRASDTNEFCVEPMTGMFSACQMLFCFWMCVRFFMSLVSRVFTVSCSARCCTRQASFELFSGTELVVYDVLSVPLAGLFGALCILENERLALRRHTVCMLSSMHEHPFSSLHGGIIIARRDQTQTDARIGLLSRTTGSLPYPPLIRVVATRATSLTSVLFFFSGA